MTANSFLMYQSHEKLTSVHQLGTGGSVDPFSEVHDLNTSSKCGSVVYFKSGYTVNPIPYDDDHNLVQGGFEVVTIDRLITHPPEILMAKCPIASYASQ